MKKILSLLVAFMLLCSAAMAAPAIEMSKDANDKTIINVTLPGQDWEYTVEDTNVLDLGDMNFDDEANTTWMLFYGKSAGVSGIELSNGVEEYTVSAVCDENGSLSVLAVNDLTEVSENIEDIELLEDEAVASIVLNGEGWGANIDSDDVLTLVSETYDEANDQTTFEFLSGNAGVSDVSFSNGTEDEEITVAVTDDGEINIVSLLDNEINAGYTVDFTMDGATLTVVSAGEAIADSVNENIASLTGSVYDEAADTTTMTFTAGENGTTEIMISDGFAALTITVTVADGEFIEAYTANTDIAVANIVNPNGYDIVEVCDVYVDDDDELVLVGKLGTITDGERIAFDSEEPVVLYISEDAEINVPADAEATENTPCADFVEWLANRLLTGENFLFDAAVTMDQDGTVTSLTYIFA